MALIILHLSCCQVSEDPDVVSEIPQDPPLLDTADGMIMRVPDEIRPAMQKHRIEVNFRLMLIWSILLKYNF